MRYSGANFEYGVIKLEYVDPDNNSDKFYHVVIDTQNQTWWAHYGRNGTLGSYTEAKSIGRKNAGIKKALEKMDKGYDLVAQGMATFATQPTNARVTQTPLRERKFI